MISIVPQLKKIIKDEIKALEMVLKEDLNRFKDSIEGDVYGDFDESVNYYQQPYPQIMHPNIPQLINDNNRYHNVNVIQQPPLIHNNPPFINNLKNNTNEILNNPKLNNNPYFNIGPKNKDKDNVNNNDNEEKKIIVDTKDDKNNNLINNDNNNNNNNNNNVNIKSDNEVTDIKMTGNTD